MRAGDPVGHDTGAGPLPAHAPIAIDLWPQDEASGCWSDMTRTFVRGDISDAVDRAAAAWSWTPTSRRAPRCARASPAARSTTSPATSIEAAGYRTRRSVDLRRAAARRLPVRPRPRGRASRSTRRPGWAWPATASSSRATSSPSSPASSTSSAARMRVEDLLLVTADGSENLTAALSYDLTPYGARGQADRVEEHVDPGGLLDHRVGAGRERLGARATRRRRRCRAPPRAPAAGRAARGRGRARPRRRGGGRGPRRRGAHGPPRAPARRRRPPSRRS